MAFGETNNEFFERVATPYLKARIIRVIYSTDSFCICNLANQCYGMFVYPHNFVSRARASREGMYGLLIRKEDVRAPL